MMHCYSLAMNSLSWLAKKGCLVICSLQTRSLTAVGVDSILIPSMSHRSPRTHRVDVSMACPLVCLGILQVSKMHLIMTSSTPGYFKLVY